ncbi:MAG: ATP-binding cassette domain-containing protein [Muribaculaceae bacterium]|nr:ATP-binding cassette domain-containing protein [Muribaculaceae bacterium]
MSECRNFIVRFESDRIGYGKVVLDNSAKGGIPAGVTAIVGKNGSGKTTLGNVLAKGRYAYGNRLAFDEKIKLVKMLTFTDIHSFTGIDVQYYNQRMEATANDNVPSVGDIFKVKLHSPEWKKYSDAFRLHDIEGKKINYLSSGELRKLLIINALCEKPDLLILDNPYIGLDADSRKDFDDAMIMLKDKGVSVVFLLCDEGDVPDYVDSVINMEDRRIGYPIPFGGSDVADRANKSNRSNKSDGGDEVCVKSLPAKIGESKYRDCEVVFSIRDGHARYGDKVIFEELDWTVKRGECWALQGPNGSGKSLLLSMICADNPQGYANDIILFDRRRGTGESIWEIKDAIGYVCPEMQLYFKSNDSVKEIIIQGMRNSLNRYRKSTPEEQKVAEEWMRILDIGHLGERKFSELSSGEQRIVMLARALVKQPALLVLDEPLHGLDKDRKERIKKIISKMVRINDGTMIYVSHYKSELPECITHTKEIMSRKETMADI